MQVMAPSGELHVELASGPPSTLHTLRLDADYIQLEARCCLHHAPESVAQCYVSTAADGMPMTVCIISCPIFCIDISETATAWPESSSCQRCSADCWRPGWERQQTAHAAVGAQRVRNRAALRDRRGGEHHIDIEAHVQLLASHRPFNACVYIIATHNQRGTVSAGMPSEIPYNAAPPQVLIIQKAEAQAHLGRHLVDWIAHCGAAAVVLGSYMNDNKRGILAVGVGHVRIQSATTVSPAAHHLRHMQDVRLCTVPVCRVMPHYCVLKPLQVTMARGSMCGTATAATRCWMPCKVLASGAGSSARTSRRRMAGRRQLLRTRAHALESAFASPACDVCTHAIVRRTWKQTRLVFI